MKKIELLAPAGNFECLMAAVQNGADAVYFAGKNFGARSFADNFDNDALKRAIDYCHTRGVKTHIAVNTAYSDGELLKVMDFVNLLYREGADALIVSDMGLVSEIRRNFPVLPLHASTQMTIHNLDGAKFAKEQGFERVVLSRELSFEDILYITENSGIDIEIFAHGALCMCYSGQCLLSSVIGGRSGNRGSCAQPCRLPFSGDGTSQKHILSLKDMCLIEHIDKIKKSNIVSLKIEGRMKGPGYVAAAVNVYKKYIENSLSVSEYDKDILEKIFFRGGLTDGYFTGKIGKNMFDFSKPDNPYLKQTKEILKSFEKNYSDIEDKKHILKLDFSAEVGKNPHIKISSDGFDFEYEYNKQTEKAKNNPTSEDMIKTQLLKTGGTPFEFSSIDIHITEDVFFSKSELNDIRRSMLNSFEKAYLKQFKREFKEPKIDEIELSKQKGGFSAYISTIKQLSVVCEYDFERIYVPLCLVNENSEIFERLKNKIVISLPEIIKDSEKEFVQERIEKLYSLGYDMLLIHNYGQLLYRDKFKLILSHRFNIWNSSAISHLKNQNILSFVISPELSQKMICDLNLSMQGELIAYGNLPVMITENCIIKNTDNCPCDKDKFYYITDRMGAKFPVKSGLDCRSVLYNCVPIYSADKLRLSKVFEGYVKQLFFTVEKDKEVRMICDDYFGYKKNNPPEEFTRGYNFK